MEIMTEKARLFITTRVNEGQLIAMSCVRANW